MKKLLLVPALLVSFLASVSAYAVEGIGVLDMRTAMLATQVYKDAAKSLQEESEFAGNLEQAQLLQSEMQSMSEKLQKDAETLSQEEISQMQRDMQTKNKDLEFLAGKLQAKQEETADKVFRLINPKFNASIALILLFSTFCLLCAIHTGLYGFKFNNFWYYLLLLLFMSCLFLFILMSSLDLNFKGDKDDEDIGKIEYNNSTNAMTITTNTATAM